LQCVLQLKVLISGFLNESNKAHSSIVFVVDRVNFKSSRNIKSSSKSYCQHCCYR